MSSDPGDEGGLFINLKQTTEPLELHLYPDALITGTISSPNGKPLAHLRVEVRRSAYDESGHHWLTAGFAETDSHGQFRLPVPAGDYRLHTRYDPRNTQIGEAILPVAVPPSDNHNAAQAIRLRGGDELHFDLHPGVRRTFLFILTVQSDTGRAFQMVTARASDGSTFSLGAMPTQQPSQFQVDLPSGSYSLTGHIRTPEAVEIAETRATVTDHETSGVVLRFHSIAAIPVELVIDSSVTSDNAAPAIVQFGVSLQNVDPDSEDVDSRVQLETPCNAPPVLNTAPGTYRLQGRRAND